MVRVEFCLGNLEFVCRGRTNEMVLQGAEVEVKTQKSGMGANKGLGSDNHILKCSLRAPTGFLPETCFREFFVSLLMRSFLFLKSF